MFAASRRLIVACIGLWAVLLAFPRAAAAIDEYRLDDGAAESNIGILSGGADKSLAWLNRFVVQLGEETITHVNIAFGNIGNGKQVTVYLWADPNQDGDPDDAYPLSSFTGVTANSGSNAFNSYDIPDVTLSAGNVFFAGAVIHYNDPGNGFTPARIDYDGTDAGAAGPFVPNNHSFIAGSTNGTNVDPANLDLAQLPVAHVSTALGNDGNWLIRANAAPPPPLCPAPGDCDLVHGTPGCNDAACCNTVCAVDPLCCTVQWDALCVSHAQSLCGGGGGGCSGLCPTNLSWSLAASGAPSPRWGHAMAYDAVRDRTVLFGGLNDNQTWEWDGTAWSLAAPATLPAGRTRPRLAFDQANGVMVMFGGQDATSYFGDTWLWDGTNWQQASPSNAPSPRVAFAMTYDTARQRVVLFGGQDAAGISLGDTWEWDGATWTQVTSPVAPAPRIGHAMAYDSARGVTVLYGGGPAWITDETWEWDGTTWTQRFPATDPGLRNGHKMAYDAARNTTVLYGGNNLPANTDVWTWDGTNWSADVANAPGPRSEHAMAYHASTHQVVLFGGVTSGPMNDDTWVYPGDSITQHYLIIGQPTGTGWSWNANGQTIDICDLNVPGVPAGQGNLALAQAFASSINNAGCAGLSATAVFVNPSVSYFTITVGGTQPFDICVGPFGQSPTCCVNATGSCQFNPEMVPVELSGEDCDANGMDDTIDLLAGDAIDENGNDIPDSCEWFGACCFPDGSCAYTTIDECPGVFHADQECDDVECDPLVFGESFDIYPDGPLAGQGGWSAWDGDPAAADFLVETGIALSAPKALVIDGNDDAVQTFEGGGDLDPADPTAIELTAWQFVPGELAGSQYFVLLNTYVPGGPKAWSLELAADGANGLFLDWVTGDGVELVTDEWAQIRVVVDFGADTQDVYYNDQLLVSKPWTDDDGAPALAAIDLWAAGSDVPVYYDDITIVEIESSGPAADLDGDGIVGGADLGLLLGQWGACDACDADLDGDGDVDGADLGVLLGTWG